MERLLVLLLLDPGQHLAKTLVLDDGRVAHALQVVGYPDKFEPYRIAADDLLRTRHGIYY